MIEMIVVVVIVGVAGTLVVTSMSKGLAASRSRTVGQVVVADLERAFSIAALQRRPVRVTWTAATSTYTLTDRRSGTVLLSRAIGMGTDFGVATVTFSASPVDVFPGGTASSALTVTLASGSSSHVVSMTRAGLVRVN